jgi:sec-independent protein translocase protein TatC
LSAMALLSVYSLILPEIATILLGFEIKNQILIIQLEARIDSYINWSSKVFLAVLLCGQLPLISYVAFRVGLLAPNLLTKKRKPLLALSLLMAAFLSPPDLIAQWLVTIFISCWIETIIWLGMICNRKR